MTAKEKDIVRECIGILMEEDGEFHVAIVKLGKLCDTRFPAFEMLMNKKVKTVTVGELIREIKNATKT